MTSPASTQNVPAPNSTAPSATASYASAAGASGKVAATPVIASGSALSTNTSAPVVVGSTTTSAVPANAASAVNGNAAKPGNNSSAKNVAKPVIPAVPAVINGSSAKDHARKSSVTFSATGPSGYHGSSNGDTHSIAHPRAVPVFGYMSPSVSSVVPNAPANAIPIPGRPAVPSPAQSPSPIPQPAASGGRPSSTMAPDAVKFGSFGGEPERAVRPNLHNIPPTNLPAANQSPHIRRGSAHSTQSQGDLAGHPPNHGPGPHNHSGPNHGHHPGPSFGRGGFNRGDRGGYNSPHYQGQPMGYPGGGNGYGRAPPMQGRGGMQSLQARNFNANSPQAARVSPAIPPAMPNNGTPHMQTAIPATQPMNGGYINYQPYSNASGLPPTVNTYGQGFGQNYNVGYPSYGQLQYANAPQPQAPIFTPGGFVNQPPHFPQGAPAMSRNSSQAASERPGSSTGPAQTPVIPAQVPVGPAGTAPGATGTAKPSAPTTVFVKPRKSAAIVIKNPLGETIDVKNLKAPASPGSSAPAISQTPPATTPTQPPKATTPIPPAKNDSRTEQLRHEFIERVHKTAGSPADGEKSETEENKSVTEETKPAVSAVPSPAAPKAEKAEVVPAVPSTSKPAEAPAATSTDESKPIEPPKAEEPITSATPAAPAEDAEDEIERAIREMEEAEAKREAEEAAYNAMKKEKAEAERLANAAENDRALREKEREMERLEEEREQKREAREKSGGPTKTVSELLLKIEDITLSERKEGVTTSATPEALASKLGEMTLGGDHAKSALSPSETASKPRTKPSALNLAPLNTKAVEPPEPSAALQSLKTARFLRDPTAIAYPKGIQSPNPALNPAVNKKGNFKYDTGFLLQFKDVFTEKPSLDFDQQVKQLIGEGEGPSRSGTRTPAASSGRQNSRNNASSSFGSMGAMGSFGSKPLPAGTTSEQRFAMSSNAIPRPSVLPSYNRPTGFPGPSLMARTPSASMGGAMPNSPRQNSRPTRGGGGSRRDMKGKDSGDADQSMPLTRGLAVKPITVSATGWKPSSVGNVAQGPTPGAVMDPPMVQRKVKAALNKMTPENFNRVAPQIRDIANQSKDEEDGRTLRQVIQLTFEKATDEAHWAGMYARFCKYMLDKINEEDLNKNEKKIRDVTIKDKAGNVVSSGALFRKYLLNRCQEEFERGWKVDLPKPKDGEKATEAEMLSDEYYLAAAAKRRGLGLLQFIGELYKLEMLTERIMHECVRKLVDYETVPDEAEIESLCKLLRTVGANLDRNPKGHPMMDAYFGRIKSMSEIPELPNRLKFMLMNVLDLRAANWESKDANKGPKTLSEVRQEAEVAAAQKAAEAARSNQRGPGGRQMGGRDSRQFSYNQPIPNQVGMDDLRRLKGSASRIASSSVTTLGPTSMFASRSNSGRRNGPGGSFGRPGDDSSPASRTGTPPTRTDSNAVSYSNAFEALATVDTETPASPPSTAASPAMSKANVDKTGK